MSSVENGASNPTMVLGIRRESKNRWERRAPVAPSHVKKLVEKGVKVIVQSSSLRTFSDRQYLEAGAVIQEDLSEANLIICVKEIPANLLLPNKTYMFFSHTIKAQEVNMPMLDDILQKNIRLIDYELITDSKNARLVRFGKFAGYAGMVDTFHAIGDRLLALGHSTPFLHVGYSYCYSNLDNARAAVKEMGEELAHYGLPDELVPMNFIFTSDGNVSQGAQDIFNLLPHKWVTPEEMVDLTKNKEKASPFLVYGVLLRSEDYMVPNDPSAKFDKKDYYTHPENYRSIYYERYASSASIIMNCQYWDYRFPRMLSISQMQDLVERGENRLLAVGDISCDRGGSIEFLMKTTSIDQPLFVYDPLNQEVYDSTTDRDFIYKRGVLFLAVDNLPTEFPKEATQYFGDSLLPFLEPVLKSDITKPYEQQTDLPQEVYKAVIATHNQLTPKYRYIMDLRKENEKSFKKILLLGAGYVSAPVVEYLSRNPKHHITVADKFIEQAESIIQGEVNCTATSLDIHDQKQLDTLVGQHTLVICLVPAVFNTIVAESCLRMKKHLITASYISPKMREMHDAAEKAGLVFLNEIGLDPGIDHLEAMRVIDDIHQKGGIVKSFVSWCGGLPMPEFSVNPLGYKFSWSPKGVLSAATKDAKYLQDDRIVEVSGNTLFKHSQPLGFFPGLNLEGVPNRDATQYIKEYGLTNEVKTFFRGTIRFNGYSQVLEALVDIGLLSETPVPFLAPEAPEITWNETLRRLLGANTKDTTRHALRKRLTASVGFPSKGYDDDKIRKVLDAFEWLGLFSELSVSRKGSYIDCLCDLLSDKLKYEEHEKDMIILHHIFGVEWNNGSQEILTSSLVVRGDHNFSAMARTVGLPVAIAAELVLKGGVSKRGVFGPIYPEIYIPILKTLSNDGIKFLHSCVQADL